MDAGGRQGRRVTEGGCPQRGQEGTPSAGKERGRLTVKGAEPRPYGAATSACEPVRVSTLRRARQ